MGVADFAWANPLSFRRSYSVGSEGTEITLDHVGESQVASSRLGLELYKLQFSREKGFSMVDHEGKAVLTAIHDEDPETFRVLDRHGQIFASAHRNTFTWEGIQYSWKSGSYGIVGDASFVLKKEVVEGAESPRSPVSPKDGNLAEVILPSGRDFRATLKVYVTLKSPTYPPLGLVLFQAFMIHFGWQQASGLQRLTFSPIWDTV